MSLRDTAPSGVRRVDEGREATSWTKGKGEEVALGGVGLPGPGGRWQRASRST